MVTNYADFFSYGIFLSLSSFWPFEYVSKAVHPRSTFKKPFKVTKAVRRLACRELSRWLVNSLPSRAKHTAQKCSFHFQWHKGYRCIHLIELCHCDFSVNRNQNDVFQVKLTRNENTDYPWQERIIICHEIALTK